MQRLSFGLESPIDAAAILALLCTFSLMPLDFLISSKKCRDIIVFIQYIICIIFAACLGLTQTRGAIVAVIAGLLGYLIFLKRLSRPCAKAIGLRGVLVVVTVVLALLYSGADRRFSPDVILHSGSVSNRIQIWRAASHIVSICPMKGVGIGNAGPLYSNWYADADTSYMYSSIMNSYLQIAVELGSPALFFLLFVYSFIFACSVKLMFAESAQIDFLKWKPVVAALTSVLISDFVVNLSSTQFYVIVHNIVLVPTLLSLSVLLIRFSDLQLLRKCLAYGILVSGMSIVGIYLIGSRQGPEGFMYSFDGDLNFHIRKTEVGSSRSAILLVDTRVAGAFYGKVVKRWVENSHGGFDLCVPNPEYSLKCTTRYSRAIALGDTVGLAGYVCEKKLDSLILIHPAEEMPDFDSISILRVYMPKFDIEIPRMYFDKYHNAKTKEIISTDAMSQSIKGNVDKINLFD